MRKIYTFALYLLLPFILARAAWRARKNKDQLFRLKERLGFYSGKNMNQSIWLHAVSYGEAVAAEPLLKKLKIAYPKMPIVITTMTVTGALRVQTTWLKDTQIHHHYLPYDFPAAFNRFFDYFHPKIGIIMETELWPNLLATAGKKGLPLLLANARLSPKSLTGYQKISFMIAALLKQLSIIAAQSQEDAARFLALGASETQIKVLGNLKFDIQPPESQIKASQAFRKRLPFDHIFVAASTHSNEEEQLLEVYENLRIEFPNILLILVPRHPERFDEVANLCLKRKYVVARRSHQSLPTAQTQVFLGDSMGELYFYYGLADLAFVGGSLVPVGGHNLLEPACLRLPLVTGPHLFNFTLISRLLQETGALQIGANTTAITTIAKGLLKDKAFSHHIGEKGFGVIEKNQGATDRHLQAISNLLV